MKPLGLSLWQLTTRRADAEAGGRLFVDVTPTAGLAGEPRRLLEASARSDPLIGDALQTVLDRGDFIPPLPDEGPAAAAVRRRAGPDRDRSGHRHRADRAQPGVHRRRCSATSRTMSGPALLDFILADIAGAAAGPVRSAEPSR